MALSSPRPSRILTGQMRLLLAATFFFFCSLYVFTPILPVYVIQLGGSRFEASLVIATLTGCSLVLRPIVGAAIDRHGARPFLRVGASIFLAAALGYLPVGTVLLLIVLRAVQAIGLCSFSTAANTQAADLAPPGRQGETIGWYGMAQTTALAVAPAISATALPSVPIRHLFLLSALCALTAIGLVWTLPPPPKREGLGPEHLWPGRPPTLWTPRIVTASLAYLSCRLSYGAILAFLPITAYERGIEGFGLFFTVLAITSVGIRAGVGRISDLVGRKTVSMPAMLAVTAALVLLSGAGSLGALLLAGALWGLGTGSAHTALQSLVIETAPPSQRAATISIFTAASELGVGLGAVLLGAAGQFFGLPAMFLIAAGIVLVGLLVHALG